MHDPHVIELCREHNIKIVTPRNMRGLEPEHRKFMQAAGSCALRKERAVYLPDEYTNPRVNYIVALHEIGHILSPLPGWEKGRSNITRRLKDEQRAWEWAFEHARPRLLQTDIETATDSYLHHATAPFLDRVMELYNEAKLLKVIISVVRAMPEGWMKLAQMMRLEMYANEIENEMNAIARKYILP